jgi:hypothetical protein
VATHGNRFGAHGKEGVNGSSPLEGSAKAPHVGRFCAFAFRSTRPASHQPLPGTMTILIKQLNENAAPTTGASSSSTSSPRRPIRSPNVSRS